MDKAQPPDVISAGPPGVPPPPPPPPSGRPRDEDRLTRKPLSLWDRTKFLLLLVLLWFSFLYGSYNGAMVVSLTEVVPRHVRTAGFSLAYSLATALLGGFGTQLVTSTRRARPEYVQYARVAKKVDVRKLKENMWAGLQFESIDLVRPCPSCMPCVNHD